MIAQHIVDAYAANGLPAPTHRTPVAVPKRPGVTVAVFSYRPLTAAEVATELAAYEAHAGAKAYPDGSDEIALMTGIGAGGS